MLRSARSKGQDSGDRKGASRLYAQLVVIGAINDRRLGIRLVIDTGELPWRERTIEAAAKVDRIDESREYRFWAEARRVPALTTSITCSRAARLAVVLGKL